MTGYIYDSDGAREMKGSLTSFSCNGSTNGFSLTNSYILGAEGEQLSELDGSGNWLHTNVYAGAGLLATYTSGYQLHYHFSDWLGSRRIQASNSGTVEETCWNQPFGENLACSGTDATEHHFTGKERDAESGNDYFGARYYASSMGRFMSPDWSDETDPVPNAGLADPQSLNLYAFVQNNPTSFVDPDGHECFAADGMMCSTHGGPGTLMDAFRADLGSQITGQQTTSVFDDFDDRMGLTSDLMSQVSTTLGDQPGPYGYDDTPSGIIMNFQAAGTISMPVPMPPMDWAGALGRAITGGLEISRALEWPFLLVFPTAETAAGPGKDTITGIPIAFADHRKGKSKAKWNKHSNPRPGRPTTKDRKNPKWKPRTPPRPQDLKDDSN